MWSSILVHLQIIVCYLFHFVGPCDLFQDKATCQVHFNSSDCVWNDSTSSCLRPERCVQPKISGETVKINGEFEPEHNFVICVLRYFQHLWPSKDL